MAGAQAKSGRGQSQRLLGQDQESIGASKPGHLTNAELLHYAVTGELRDDSEASAATNRRASKSATRTSELASVPIVRRRAGRPKGSGRLIPDLDYAVTQYQRIRSKLGHGPSATEFCSRFRPPQQRTAGRRDAGSRSGVPIASETGVGISAETLNRFLLVLELTWEQFDKLARKRD